MCTLALTTTLLVAQRPVARIQNEINNSDMVPLRGSQSTLGLGSQDAGRMATDAQMKGISIVFNRSAEQQAALEELLKSQQDPSSPEFHHWLTPEEFGARFGMAQKDVEMVQGWLEQQGLAVDGVAPSRNMIRFSGTVRQVEQAFQTEMHYYRTNGETKIAPSKALSVPAAIAPTVEAVGNLSTLRPRPMHVRTQRAFTSGQSGENFFAPGDIAATYDIQPLYSAGIDGSGQSIAIIGQSAVKTTDIENFESAAGLKKKDPVMVLVPQSGSSTVVSGDEGESDLDLEWAGAIAKGATIYFVYTGVSPNTHLNAFDALQYAIYQNIAKIISISYGACETAVQKANFSLESVFQQAAAQGQTILASSGDQGSTACSGDSNGLTQAEQNALAVNYPASSPYVTGVGGTEISRADATSSTYWDSTSGSDLTTSAKRYIPEVVWDDTSSQYGLSASGGGQSAMFSKPSWQKGVAGIPGDGKRDVPDVSLYSSPDLPGYVFCTSDASDWRGASSSGPAQAASCTSGFRDGTSGGNYLTVAGGTSFAAPIFAGMIALINQQRGWTEGSGLANTTLYKLAADSGTYASAFHDVTSGNNKCSAGTVYCGTTTGGFSAGKGYDEVTGLGSVDLANLASVWPSNSIPLIATTTKVSAATTTPMPKTDDVITISVSDTSGSGTPTGKVDLSIDGGGTSYNSGGSTSSVTLGANGTATYKANFATAGVHTIVAQYAGDATHAASSGSVSVTVSGGTSAGKKSFAIALAPPSLTLKRGAKQVETLTVTPAGGYTGTVDLGYVTSNDAALAHLCVLIGTGLNNNGSASVNAASPLKGQITIDTNAVDCASSAIAGGSLNGTGAKMLPRIKGNAAAMPGRNVPLKNNSLPAEFAFAGLVLAGFLGRSSRKLRNLACVIALVSIGLVLSACGGTSGRTLQDPPKGTYTITFTGTDSADSSLTSQSSFTLVID